MSTSASVAFADLLRQRLAGIAELSPLQVAALEAHYQLLLHWNRTLNLTTVAGVEAVERHYCESIFLAAHLPPGELRIIDIGSGAGFPGYPVAIFRTDCQITLVESHQRKSVFLREAARKQSNVRIVAKRAEEVREEFDRAISRAVSYEDLSGFLKKLAPNADLLTGAEDPHPELGFEWDSPVALPWGKQRFLRIGHRISNMGGGGAARRKRLPHPSER